MIVADHYDTLGVRPDADRDEIRAAYLTIIRACHPDRTPGDEHAADRARAANAAWDVLGDSTRRAAYDRLRTVRQERIERGPARVTGSAQDAEMANAAYSADRFAYRDDVTRGLLKIAAAVFTAGFVLLLLLS